MASRNHFRQELRAQIGEAIKRGDPNLVVADELHRAVGQYPGPQHRMRYCCEMMREEMKDGDRIVTQGPGESLMICYQLPHRTLSDRY